MGVKIRQIVIDIEKGEGKQTISLTYEEWLELYGELTLLFDRTEKKSVFPYYEYPPVYGPIGPQPPYEITTTLPDSTTWSTLDNLDNPASFINGGEISKDNLPPKISRWDAYYVPTDVKFGNNGTDAKSE